MTLEREELGENLSDQAQKIEGQKRMLSKESKNEMILKINKEINLITTKLNELVHNLMHLAVNEKNSEGYVEILKRDTNRAINEAKELICKLNDLKDGLEDIETQKL